MSRYVALYVLTLLLALAVALAVQAFALKPVVAQSSGDVYIYGHVEPRVGFALIRIVQPGGVVIEKLTDSRGEWGVGVRWRAGYYRLECDDAIATYKFGITQGETASGPWVFALWGFETPTPTQQPITTITNTPYPTIAMPTPTPTEWDVAPTATATLPQPDVTPLVMRLQSDGEDYVGEIMVELWVDEQGEIEVVNLSGAVWRR